jgi:magnesium transporter
MRVSVRPSAILNIFRGERAPPGAAPGTLVRAEDASPTQITVWRYGPDGVDERPVSCAADVKELLSEEYPVTWINVDGLADLDAIHTLGVIFDFHRLALEDVVSVSQRPKAEDYGDFLFVITRMPHYRRGEEIDIEQVSFYLKEGVLITFQEKAGDCWNQVRDRIRQHRGLLRNQGADYLMYALLDSVADSYFPILEQFGDSIEELNDRIIAQAEPSEIHEMHEIRQELIKLRRAIWPQRDMFNSLIREQHRFVGETAAIYLRDCYDHAVQLLDLVETYREIAATSMELYISSVNNRMNEIMKVLTIIATIFIPMSFVTGLYGMNFDTTASPWNMPELHWVYGYPFALGVMGCIAGVLLFWFWRRGWIGFGR